MINGSFSCREWGCNYDTFFARLYRSDLDLEKFEVYIKLRKLCIDNIENFDVTKYPLIPETPESLETLYAEISLNKEEVDRIIADREAARRRQLLKDAQEKTAKNQLKYVERYKKLKSLNFTTDEDDLQIVVPKQICELIIEGQELHHCVGSFVDSVSEGRDTIVFLRKKDNLETPYVTVSLLKDTSTNRFYIDQAHGDHNSAITLDDVEFLKKWGQTKNLVMESIKQNYGAKCHH